MSQTETQRIERPIDVAQEGFTVIRNLLEGRVKGGSAAAAALAEALHNLPIEQENSFTHQLTSERLTAFFKIHPGLQRHMPQAAAQVILDDVDCKRKHSISCEVTLNHQADASKVGGTAKSDTAGVMRAAFIGLVSFGAPLLVIALDVIWIDIAASAILGTGMAVSSHRFFERRKKNVQY
ncbi:MAG: hypothetical protein ACFHHU_00955 [Porticoccaceae bacterium]